MTRWLGRRVFAGLVIGLLLVMAVPWAAFASDVDVISVVDVTAPTGSVTLAPGGSGAITINLKVTGNQKDSATFQVYRDWTLSGGTFSGSNPETFTVLRRTGISSEWNASASGTVTVATGQAAGTFTLTVGVFNIQNIDPTGNQLTARNTASYSVTVVPPANTPPSVSVSGVTDGASYEIGAVPAATCDVTDAEDGNSSPSATLSAISGPLAGYGLGSQTASCSYTDLGDLTASASATYSIVDTSNPSITDLGPTAGPDGANGWYVSAVTNEFEASDSGAGFLSPLTNPYTFTQSSGTAEGAAVKISSGTVTDVAGNAADAIDSVEFKIDLSDPTDVAFVGGITDGGSYGFSAVPAAPTCTATDAVSGLDTCAVTGYSAALGSHTLTATATDNAGRTATATLIYTVVDDTAPVITYTLTPTAPDGDNGWYTSDVTLTWSVVEDESPDSLVKTGCDDQSITADQAATTYSCAATSDGGSTDPIDVTIKRDATAPVVTVTGVADGASYVFGSVPAAGCTTTDAMSGVAASATLSTNGGPLGSVTATCDGAKDNAGNVVAPVSVTYTVLAWTLSGFYQPVDMGGVFNIVKGGSTVPLKFEIFKGATESTDVADIKSLTAKVVACSMGALVSEVEEDATATGNTSLRYDTTAGQFIYNWKTPKTPGKCYAVTMTAQDGSSLTALFKLK